MQFCRKCITIRDFHYDVTRSRDRYAGRIYGKGLNTAETGRPPMVCWSFRTSQFSQLLSVKGPIHSKLNRAEKRARKN